MRYGGGWGCPRVCRLSLRWEISNRRRRHSISCVWRRKSVQDFPEARFAMVGDGPLRPAAEELARSLGIGARMVFCGWWDDVPGLLAATTVSVLTSRHEGLPCSVVESLAAGVPVVATAVDGTAGGGTLGRQWLPGTGRGRLWPCRWRVPPARGPGTSLAHGGRRRRRA